MWYINFSEANCKGCYSCVMVCPVNAIKVENDQANIMKERCIICGRCLKRCPQNAKSIKSDVQTVKQYLNSNKTVVVSIAPSFLGVFGNNSSKLLVALKKLGFKYIEETISGLEPVISQYNKYINEDDNKAYITSLCPSVTNLIQIHYPELIENIIPVISISMYHSRVLKEKYGHDSKIVFIGPCLSKKTEAYEDDSLDAVITFEELDKWIKDENIDISKLDEEELVNTGGYEKLFSMGGGPSLSIERLNPNKSFIEVDGIDECIEVLNDIKKGKFNDSLIEMSICRNSCLGGSGIHDDGISSYERKENLKKLTSNKLCKLRKDIELDKTLKERIAKISINRQFRDLSVKTKQPTEEEMQEILRSFGKKYKEDELNCGSCGYRTCREKAIAIHNGRAETNMCLPFIKKKVEDLSNVIFNTTPNIIIFLDKELDVIKMNKSACEFFDIEEGTEEGIPVIMLVEEDDFEKVKTTKQNIIKEKLELPQYNATVMQNIIWMEDHEAILWIASDITRDEKLEKKIQQMKLDSITMAQQVIDKQMRVAQEIASLLGETTAETKVTLTKLKHLVEEDETI